MKYTVDGSLYVHILCGVLSCEGSSMCKSTVCVFTLAYTPIDDSECPWIVYELSLHMLSLMSII